MATKRNNDEAPKKWEVLGVFFGFFATAKDAPTVFRALAIRKLLPTTIKTFLLAINDNANFWYTFLFTMLSCVLLFGLLIREKVHKELPDQDDLADDDNLKKILNRAYFFSYVKSLGLLFIRNWILGIIGVEIYGTFRRQSDWEPRPNYFQSIDRIAFSDGSGKEFQFSKNYQKISIRVHPSGDVTYGLPEERKPTWKEIRVLLLASNFFPFWWFIPHLIVRPFVK